MLTISNGKEGESSMQAATIGATRYHPLTRTGTGGDAGKPIHFVLSGRDTVTRERARALKTADPQVAKYGSASCLGKANAIHAGSSSSSIDETEKTLTNSENPRSTVLYDRHAVENTDATSHTRDSAHQGNDNLACLTPRDWAWFISIWIHNKHVATLETNAHFGQSFPELTSACLSRHNSPHEASSSSSAALGPSEPKTFAYLLWAINMRALELLKGKERVPTYLDEQKDLMKWFIDFMKNCKDLGHCYDREGDFLHDKIMKALDSKEIDSGFLVILPEPPQPHYTVTNKQAMMNEAAVRAVTRYHKEKNHQLFKFYNNIGFVRKLAAFGTKWGNRYISNPRSRTYHPPQIFQKTQLEKYVKPINFSGGKAAEEPTEPLVLEDQGEKVWAWLSGLKSQTEQSFEEITTSNNILQEYIKQIKQEYQKEATYGPEEWGKRLYDLMWHINGSIIETMRFSGSPNDFLQEQAAIRFFFDQVLSRKKSKRLEAEALGEKTRMDKYDELLKELVFIEGKKPIFKIKHSKSIRSFYSFLSKEDIILAKIVVNIIGSYYKTQNIEKWISLFGNDENFVHFLIKLRLKQTKTIVSELAQATFYSVIPSLELFPWERRSKIMNGELPKKAYFIFRDKSRMALNSWIEDAQDKSTKN
ncbi:hypothetical protein VP01_1615g1 [Puccinia sorghi]|uniref:Uncharacterized protein n=1 Tax=Puccinia sorghi TaxID=27349 RepID=A0A0L6VH64_9BASI|nr:hypothetical protein VP01_1615g1 [Puccinia sorghi]